MFLKHEEAKREEGFTLIELLVVVIIIGILAAIAIPVFLNQRRSAWQGELTSGVRNVALEVEAAAVNAGGNYSQLPGADDDHVYLQAVANDVLGQAAADPVVIQESTATALTANRLQICAQHVSLGVAEDGYVLYDTDAGGIQPFVPDAECPS